MPTGMTPACTERQVNAITTTTNNNKPRTIVLPIICCLSSIRSYARLMPAQQMEMPLKLI